MTNPLAANAEVLNLYVTHMDADGPLLRLWAQINAEDARKIERLMHGLASQFDNGIGIPTATSSRTIWTNNYCCALFENTYYRAKICSPHTSGGYIVQFIDYGNTEILQPTDIRFLEGLGETAELLTVPPLALEFIVADVLPRNGLWESHVLLKILDNIRYKESPGRVVGTVARYPAVQMLHGDRNLTDILVEQNFAVRATLDEMLRLYSRGMTTDHQQLLVQLPRAMMPTRTQARQLLLPGNALMKYPLVPTMVPLRVPRGTAYAEVWHPQGGAPTVPGQKIQASPVSHNDEPGVFRSRILEIGEKYEVTVSYVEDGPLMFSVQVNSTAEELKNLMHHINHAHPPQPLNEPPVIGSVCLGRYSADKSLLRAVVMQVREHDCKLHYVDFGHGEILPYTDIFQLPRRYINPRILSIRFTMSNVSELRVTDEMKEYFKRYVVGKTFVLHVRPSDGPPLIQYGDLYHNGRNVKDILRAMFGDALHAWLPPRKLQPESREIVHVLSMESSLIFIQLDSDAELLEKLVAHMQKYVSNAPAVQPNKLVEGLHCIAFSNKNSQWQRAEVKNVTEKSVTVYHVDYAYEETVPLAYIKAVTDPSLMKLRAQAIRCFLNEYDTEITSKELHDRLKEEITSSNVAMIVNNVTPAGPIVDLYDANIDPLVNIIHRLKMLSAANGNVQSRIDPYNEKTTNSSHSTNNRSDIQSNNWKNPPRTERPAEIIADSNSPAERGKSSNWKNENNEPRRYENRENRYQNRDKEWSPNSGANERFPRNDGKTDRPSREGPRFERAGDPNGNIRGGRTENRDRGGFGNARYPANGSRNERIGSVEKSWSDKDSDTSSKGSGRSGRRGGPRGGGNRGRRDGGRRPNSRESDGDSDRGTFRSARMTQGASSRIRDNKRDFGTPNENRQIDTWTNKTPPKPQAIGIPSPNITVGAVKNCEVVYMKDPGDFHVQLCPDNLELDPIIAKIEATYENAGKIVERSRIKAGLECVAQYSEDSKWYRARIQSVEANGATVYFVDYGNIETVEFDKIKELEADCAKLSAQAIACKLLAANRATWDSNDIDKFTDLTSKPLLEAEFVANENNVFDVLLREVIDDKPCAKYINEEFSDGADIVRAKNEARSKGRPRAGSNFQQPTDYAPLDDKWPVENLAPGTKDNIIIACFLNPDTFYCQTLAGNDAFRAMMLDIQKVYASRQPVKEPLQVGSAVMAVYADDGALYRAEILELNKARGNIVRYVDFGNTAMVELRQTYRVEKKYMKIPKQAAKCSLKNIVPGNGTNWAKSNKQEIEKCFQAETIECTFHEQKDGKYLVSLKTGDVDIAGLLVEKSLAAFAVSAHVDVDKHAETMEKQPIIEDLPRFDISLLAGQALRVKVSNVASATKFHIQLPSATATEKAIHAYMAQRNPEVMPRLSCHEVCLGAGCLVQTDEGWRRAVVVNCSRTTGFDVRLIDTGANDEIPLNCMLALPGPLSVMQNQAVECCLKDAKTNIVLDEKLRDRIENTVVIVAVEQVDNNRLIVKLYDTNGHSIKLNRDDEDEEISPICPMPILYSTQKVVVSHAENSSSVWLKRQMELDADTELLSQLFDHYSVVCGDDKKPTIAAGALCAAKSADENWYRSRIVGVAGSSVTVNYIDYGNNEELPLDALRVLEPRFNAQPALAIKVGLTVNVGGSIEQQREILRAHCLDQEFTATMYNVHKKWIAELTNAEGKISEKLSALEAIEVSKNPVVQSVIPEMMVGERYKVFCPHADSPASFWLQRLEERPAIEQMQKRLQEEAIKCPMLEGIPEEGTLCLAMYSVDDMWYRAEVIVADPEIISVRFIDYGNTDAVYTNQEKCKVITDSLKSIKRYAMKCRLDVIPAGDEDWMSPANEWFEGVVTNAEMMEALVIADGTPRRVELLVDEKSVVDELVQRNYGSRISPDENLIEEPFDPDLDLSSCFVSHVISPGEFWIQEAKNVSSLETLADRFIVADMFPTPKQITEGLLCVAKFPEDSAWYRARVVSHSDSCTEVIYIDYGNSAISTEIREIPDDVASQPAYSRKCGLALPERVDQWSEEACIEFIRIAADGETIFHPEILEERDDVSIVRLTQRGKDVAETLLELCAPRQAIIEERLAPLGEENSPNVFVSHVNSPADFSIQAQSSVTELETMSDHLAAAESFLPLDKIEEGAICAALFPEDDQWYRAKILSHGDNGTEVFYIDYGNSAITTELRVLPEDIVQKPALSTACSLQMPDDIDNWSEEACEKFIQLANEGITIFQFQFLEDKERSIVRLSIDGTDVVQRLAPLCAKKIISQSEQLVQSETIRATNVDETSVQSSIVPEQNISSTEISGVEKTISETIRASNVDEGSVESCVVPEQNISSTEIPAVKKTIPESEQPVQSEMIAAINVKEASVESFVVSEDDNCHNDSSGVEKTIPESEQPVQSETIRATNVNQASVEISITSERETSSNETSGVEVITISDTSSASDSYKSENVSSAGSPAARAPENLSGVEIVPNVPAVDTIVLEDSSGEIVAESPLNGEEKSGESSEDKFDNCPKETPVRDEKTSEASVEKVLSGCSSQDKIEVCPKETPVQEERTSEASDERVVPECSSEDKIEIHTKDTPVEEKTEDAPTESPSAMPENLSPVTVSSEDRDGNEINVEDGERRNSTPLEYRLVSGSAERDSIDVSKNEPSPLEISEEKLPGVIALGYASLEVARQLEFSDNQGDKGEDAKVDSSSAQSHASPPTMKKEVVTVDTD